MLRYRLERALISGDLACDQIPGAWAEIHEALLGIKPGNDAEGCLQDIHWSVGELGYFPSYTIGALMAAQFFDAAARTEPELWPAIERGDFSPLFGWLRANVHGLASRVRGAGAASNVPPGHPSAPPSSRLTCGGATSTEPHAHWFLHVSR